MIATEETAMVPDIAVRPEFELTFGATLPVTALPRFSGAELLSAVNSILAGTGAAAELEPDLTTVVNTSDEASVWHRTKAPPRIGLTVNGMTVQVEGFDRPAYTSSGLERLDTGAWPDCQERIERTRAHVCISEVWTTGGSDFDHNCDRAAALTVVVEAVMRVTEAVGAVWHASNCALSTEQLHPMFAAMSEGMAPMQLWLGCSNRREKAKGAMTRGLYPLLGAEIKIVSTTLVQSAAFDAALDVVAEIFRTGAPPENGSQLSFDTKSAFNVDYRSGRRTPRRERDVSKIVLTQVRLPVESSVTAGAA